MAQVSNMTFNGVHFKGQATVSGVLANFKGNQVTVGGIAKDNIPFGAMVNFSDKSAVVAEDTLGATDSKSYQQGIAIFDEARATNDISYYTGYKAEMPMTVLTDGYFQLPLSVCSDAEIGDNLSYSAATGTWGRNSTVSRLRVLDIDREVRVITVRIH